MWEYIMETVLDITEGNAGGDGVNIPSPRTQKNASVRSVRSWGEDIMEIIDVTTEGNAGETRRTSWRLCWS